jgi:hypothetical protein
MNEFCLILAAIAFGIGSLPKVAPSEINWTNAGLGLITLALILG